MAEFTEQQTAELQKPLSREHVAERTQSGRKLSYIEGWWAIAEANRIFGFDGWTRETVEMREVRPPELVKNQYGKETWRVGFMAKVRVTIGGVVREGTGFGSGALPDLGEAYESAIKEAETDAMKRALMTFGNPFGLALYDKTQANVSDGDAEPEPATKPKAKSRNTYTEMAKEIDACADLDSLAILWKSHPFQTEFKTLPPDWQDMLTNHKDARKSELAAPANGAFVPPKFDHLETHQ